MLDRTFQSGPPAIRRAEIQVGTELGSGSFGTVFRGKCRSEEVAIKRLDERSISQANMELFMHEIQVMSVLFHPNITLYMGACVDVPTEPMIVTELVAGGSVAELLRSSVPLSLHVRMRMAWDAAKGMAWLHGASPIIVHRDLKPSNLLVTEDFRVKICDFGLSQLKPSGARLMDIRGQGRGTPLWMAPEVLQNLEFSEKADVYSFGLVLWELYTRVEPFMEFRDLDEFRRAICRLGVRPRIPRDCHPDAASLMQRCWSPEPRDRPPFTDIVAQLSSIAVDCAISDLYGRHLWKHHVPERFTVGFRQLLGVLSKYLTPVADNDVRRQYQIALRAVLLDEHQATDQDEHAKVNIETFGNFLAWFGPLNSVPGAPSLLERLRLLLREPFFHGDVSQSVAEQRLSGCGVGTFLVRYSSAPGSFTLSRVAEDHQVVHQRILHPPNHPFYLFGDRSYPSLLDFVADQQTSLQLLDPCLGSRFPLLFGPQSKGNYI